MSKPDALPGARLLLALLLPALLLPWTAHADARVEARRHFKSGMQMIAEADYAGGINELLEAYAIKPHPNVLFNVAKAYEQWAKPREALEYYQRYLAFSPPDQESVEQTVRRLQASMPQKPAPQVEEKKVVERPVDPANEEALRKLAQLTARLEEALANAEKPQQVKAAPGDDAAAVASTGVEPGNEELNRAGGEAYEEMVVTASRRAQSTLEAPNSTTIITAEEIRLSGARTIPEILRRVPGAEVMAMGVGSANVSFRGFNQRLSNKVMLLVDGRNEYHDYLGMTMWPTVPIGLEEIERIEVIRGPGSTLYGANAMLGVVNIITRPPGSGKRAELHTAVGTGKTAAGSFVASGLEKALRYRASVGFEQSDKWSQDFSPERLDVVSSAKDPALGLQLGRANLSAHYAFSKDVAMSVSGGVNRLYTELYALGVLRNFFFDGVSAYAKTTVGLGPVKAKLFWNHLSALAGPQYEAVGQRSLVAKLASNVVDGELVYSDELTAVGTHHFDIGLSVRNKRVDWPDYLRGSKTELHAAAFIQDEWRILDPLRLVGSYRIDRHPLLDKGQPGFAQSPRASLLWMPAQGHALRFTFATAFRAPSFLESYLQLPVPIPGVNGGSAFTSGEQALRAERLTAFELGYRGELPRFGLEWDLALYQNEVTDLISLTAPRPLPPEQSFDEASQSFLIGRSSFFNDPASFTARGAEVGLKLAPVDGLSLRSALAFQSVTTSSTDNAACGPCTQAPAAKLTFGTSYRTPIDVDLSMDVAYISPTIWVEREPSTSDPTSINAVEYPLSDYTVLNARVGYRLWNDRVEVAVVGSHLGPGHQEHPFGNRIERRIFGTLSVTP